MTSSTITLPLPHPQSNPHEDIWRWQDIYTLHAHQPHPAARHNLDVISALRLITSALTLQLASRLSLSPPCPLLQEACLPGSQNRLLSLLDSAQPVSEACSNTGEDWISQERLLCEVRAHFNAQLPGADGKTFRRDCQYIVVEKTIQWLLGEGRTEAAPEQDFVNHF